MGPSNRRMIARTRLGSSRSPPLACHPPPVLGLTLTRGMATSIRVMRTSVGVSVVAANDRDALPTAVSQGVVRDGQAHYSEAARRRSDRRIAGQARGRPRTSRHRSAQVHAGHGRLSNGW